MASEHLVEEWPGGYIETIVILPLSFALRAWMPPQEGV
jgi:hypothetical protein